MSKEVRKLDRRQFLREGGNMAMAAVADIEGLFAGWVGEREEEREAVPQRVQYERFPRRQILYLEEVETSLKGCRDLYNKFLEELPEIPSGENLTAEAMIERSALIKFFMGGIGDNIGAFRFTQEEEKVLRSFINECVKGKEGEERKREILGLRETGGLGGLCLYDTILTELLLEFGKGKVLSMDSEVVKDVLSYTEELALTAYDQSFAAGIDFNLITLKPLLIYHKGEKRLFEYLTEDLLIDENDAVEYSDRFIAAAELNFGQVRERILADVPLPFTTKLSKGMMMA